MIRKLSKNFIIFAIFLTLASFNGYAGELTISAAASLTDALQEIGKSFMARHPEHHLYFNFAASGPLMRQIEQGAPVDLFISASPNEMNDLESKGLLMDKTRKDLMTNEVVLVIPARSPLPVKSFHDLEDPSIKKIAIGDPEFVPCGRYTKEILENLKLWDKLKFKLIFGEDVRQVLEYVSRGEVDAGVVFETDAAIKPGKVKVVAVSPENSHKPIVYPAAVIKGTKDPELAIKFIDFMESPGEIAIFKKYHFKPLKKEMK
jgi:molybdate transport system substrate-binding protein